MARMHLVALALLGLITTGCVSQDKYNALKIERDQLREQLTSADSDARAARSENEALKSQIAQIMSGNGTGTALLTNLQNQLAQRDRDMGELQAKYEDLLRNGAKGGNALDPNLTSALTTFARENPDLVDFDAARGIVKFKSDVTFALGSAELTPQAKTVIDRFSQILNSNAANSYELMVAGHTDNMRVSNPLTIQKGHKDNWYLSVHRGIAVAEELMSQHVSANRVGVAGYADQRPIASNASAAGQAQNRRVEVLILPTTVRGGGNFATGSGQPRVTPVKAVGPNKDSVPVVPVPVPGRPVFNK